MSLSPWDLSGNISFDFSLYRPRRPSYVFATRITRTRNESYRHATKTESNNDQDTCDGVVEGDYIEGVQKRGRGSGGAVSLSPHHPQNRQLNAAIEKIRNKKRLRHGPDPCEQDEIELKSVDYNYSNTNTNHVSTTSLPGDGGIVIHVPNQIPHHHVDGGNNVDHTSIYGGSMGNSSRKASRADTDTTVYAAPSVTSENREGARWRYRKNLVVLSLSFILVFTAFRSIQNLQSSLNTHQNLGVIAMGCVHGTMFLTCLFTPVLINKLTSKWTIVLGLLFYLFWIAANFYPHFYTLIPTSIGVGFGQSLAWGAQVTYIQKLAVDYAHISREVTQQELYKFNGIFLACFQTSHIWGNLVSSLMLDSEILRASASHPVDDETVNYPDLGETNPCGVYDLCDEGTPFTWNITGNSSLTPASNMVLKLMGSYLVFAFTGFVLILLFLEKIGAKNDPEKPCLQVVWNNVQMLAKHKTYRLLTPLLIFNGFEQGFVYADYNKSYISCTIGIEYVGYNMITLGVSNSLFSVLVGVVARHVPREAVIGLGAILHVGVMVFLLVWIPDRNLKAVFFVISALWGICDAVWQTQCNSLVNLSCPDEHDVAFQNFRMLQGLGASLAFTLGSFVCVAVKLYIIISLLILAILFYVVVEYQLKRAEFNSEME